MLTSVSEGFPNSIIEAMACGAPCVVTRAGDAASIVGDAGRVVDPFTPAAFAAACESLLSLPTETRAEIGRFGRERVAANYSIERIARRYEELYEQLAGS